MKTERRVEMTLFHTARIKLTLWYLLIIMAISLSFSAVMYRMIHSEIDRIEHMQQERLQRRIPLWMQQLDIDQPPKDFPPMRSLDPQDIEDAKRRLLLLLGIINLGILGISALAGYFLAGKTLRPIKNMLDDQNRFIADASHELRTPLTALKTEIEVNLRDDKLKMSDAKKLLTSNLEEVNHLQKLSDNLIKLTNTSVNQSKAKSDFELLDCVNKAVKKVLPLAKKKEINIQNEVRTAKIFGNKESLGEVLVILLDNAIKYSPDKSEIWLQSEEFDDFVQIKVMDRGIGIARKDLSYIFDRFYRCDQSRSSDGHGLGLSIAKKLVEACGGKIKVESELEKGSVFTIKLPIR